MIANLFNLILVCFFVAYIWRFFKVTKSYFIIIGLHVFFAIWLVFSVAFIESGVYNKDLMTNTYFNFSTLRLIFYEVIFFQTVLFWYKRSDLRNIKSNNVRVNRVKEKNIQVILYMGFFYTLYTVLNMLVSNNVFINDDVTRFNFYDEYSVLPFAQVVSYFAQPMALLLGVVLCKSCRKRRKVFSAIILVLLLIASYGTGNEFGVLFYLCIYYIIPCTIDAFIKIDWRTASDWIKEIFLKYKKYILLAIVVFFGACAVKIHSFTKVNVFAEYVSSPIAAFLYRAFALQGDVWWAVDTMVLDGFNDIGQIVNELCGLFGVADEQNIGIYYLMNLILPKATLNNYLWGNSTLMSGYPAINIALFGYVGAVFVIIIEASIFFWFSSYVYKKIIKQQYLRTFLAIYIYIQFLKIYNISGYYYIGNLIPILFIFILLVLETCVSQNRKYKR